MKSYRIHRKPGVIIMSLLGLFALYLIIENVVVKVSESKPVFDIPQLKKSACFDFELPDSNISRSLYLNLKSAIAIDNKSKEVLYCYNADEIRPIASISKLLTAMVVLDHYRPDSVLTITREDGRSSARSLFRVGDKVRAGDLLHAALLQSDNRAARALARSVAGNYEDFADLMNKKGDEIGLKDTKMYEPTGLDERNRSTAADCARLINAAILNYPEISRITSLKKYTITPVNRKRSKRLVNTNKMVFSKYRVKAGKTGYIIKSDYCLATILENGAGRQVTVVVLGAPGPQTRFREARRLANHAFQRLQSLADSN